MRSLRILATLAMTLALIGCGTTQQVTLTKHEAKPGIRSVATVPDEGNSSQMDANLTSALQLNGLAVRPSQRNLVEAGISQIDYYNRQVKDGKLTLEEAQTRVKDALRNVRYDGKEYFWINDFQPRMVMHPIKPELEGQDLNARPFVMAPDKAIGPS